MQGQSSGEASDLDPVRGATRRGDIPDAGAGCGRDDSFMTTHLPMHRRLVGAIVGLSLAVSVVVLAPTAASAQHDDEFTTITSPVAAAGEPIGFVAGIYTAPLLGGSEPRFIVEAVSFTAVDESGLDWAGSDEVYAIWTSADTRAVSQLFGDVDTTETRSFPTGQRCIYPIRPPKAGDTNLLAGDGDEWGCWAAGRGGPVEFSVWLFEHDGHGFPLCFSGHNGTDLDYPLSCYDDLIGTFDFSLSSEDLVTHVLPAEGSSRLITKTLGGPCGYQPPGTVCGYSRFSPTGPEYKFRFRLTRVADAGPTITLD